MLHLKKLFVLALITYTGYSVLRFIKKLDSFFKLKECISQYLFDVTGTRPVVKINFTGTIINVEVGYPEKIITEEKNIADIVKKYIDDYYPSLAGIKTQVKVYPTDY